MILLLINSNPFQLNIYLLVKKKRERESYDRKEI